MTSEALSDDEIFLASCEKLLKDRYTENDVEFMKVFNAEPSTPPIIESWWVPNNSGRRNDRRFNRKWNPISRPGAGAGRGHDHRPRAHDDRSYSHHSKSPRY